MLRICSLAAVGGMLRWGTQLKDPTAGEVMLRLMFDLTAEAAMLQRVDMKQHYERLSTS